MRVFIDTRSVLVENIGVNSNVRLFNMNPEKRLPIPEQEFTPASETEKDIPEKLRNLHEVRGEYLTRGVFFDVYDIELPDEDGNAEPFVFKDFRSGDAVSSPEEQVALFQHQYYEQVYLKSRIGDQFFPESHWIRSTEFSEDEAHGFFSVPGKTANTMQEFIKTQLDRQLADRYSSDDKLKKGAVKDLMSKLGESVAPEHEDKPFIGAIVQKKISGVSFKEALGSIDKGSPAYESLRENTRLLIRGLRDYHAEDNITAFTWHGLKSDNVMVETDESGNLTGEVFVTDANFTERPNKAFKDSVVKKLEKNVFAKLEKELDI